MANETSTTEPAERRWSVDELSRNIHRVNITLERVGDEQRVLCQSDVHWDNPHCDRDLLAKHWAQARELDAPILDNGDFFCAMQGKFDKRANKNDLRPEHQNAHYLDSLVDTAADALMPYADLLTVRGQGNHERSILKVHETHLTERLVQSVKARTKATPIALGGYSGYIVFQVEAGGRRKPFKMHYHHGFGGGGAVTRGVIQTNRQAVYLADADYVWTGHTHDSWTVRIARVKLNQDNTAIEHTEQVHFRTSGYKEEYGSGYDGWHVERGAPPKPVGAAWLVFKLCGSNGDKGGRGHVECDILEAK